METDIPCDVCVSVCIGGDEVSAASPAAVVESDTDSKQSRAGATDTKRAAPGQSLLCFSDCSYYNMYISTD